MSFQAPSAAVTLRAALVFKIAGGRFVFAYGSAQREGGWSA
jgi:hypothetical protein